MKTILYPLLLCVLAYMALASTSATFTFTDATTITWTWTEDRQTGQFCTGDWWVVGPITLTSVTRPNGAAGRDGSQLGPKGTGVFYPPTWEGSGLQAHYNSQGFDARDSDPSYNSALNIANSLPYVVPVHESVISSISDVVIAEPPYLKYQAVLTVLPSAPAAGSFRPYYGGTNKAILHNKSDIDYSKMLNLAPITGAPSLANVAEQFRYPIISISSGVRGTAMMTAQYNTPDDFSAYGANMSSATSGAISTLNFNATNAEKEAAAISFIQYGLDLYGQLVAGGYFMNGGGFGVGRKAPFVFAAIVLNDTAMKTMSITGAASDTTGWHERFAEDMSTFYVTQSDIDQPRDTETTYGTGVPFTSVHRDWPGGWAEWNGIPSFTAYDRRGAGPEWEAPYRFNAFFHLVTAAVVINLMPDGRATWNHEPFFDYCFNRYAVIEDHNLDSHPERDSPDRLLPSMTAFGTAMFDTYYGETETPSGTITTGTLNVGTLNVGN
jgi:hypothetical protein